jgi:hypothetical protein
MAAPVGFSPHETAIGRILAIVDGILDDGRAFAAGTIPYDPNGPISREEFFRVINDTLKAKNASNRTEKNMPLMKRIVDAQAAIKTLQEEIDLRTAFQLERARYDEAVRNIATYENDIAALESRLLILARELDDKNNALIQENAITVNCLEAYRIDGDADDRAAWIASKQEASDIRTILREKARDIDTATADLAEKRVLLAENIESSKIFRARSHEMNDKLKAAFAPGRTVDDAMVDLAAALQDVTEAARDLSNVPVYTTQWNQFQTSVSIVYA